MFIVYPRVSYFSQGSFQIQGETLHPGSFRFPPAKYSIAFGNGSHYKADFLPQTAVYCQACQISGRLKLSLVVPF